MGNSFSLSGDAFMPAWNCLIVRKFGSSNSQVYPLQVWQAARRLLLWLYCSVPVIIRHCWEQETERPVIFWVHWQWFVKASLPDSRIGWLKHFPIQALSDFVTTLEQTPNSHKIKYVTESNKATLKMVIDKAVKKKEISHRESDKDCSAFLGWSVDHLADNVLHNSVCDK